tara:strand:+ start:1251 stop:1847 length:597 start_codon:yes stop_codon:yes gene_type:complete
MIKFNNLSKEKPYLVFREYYEKSISAKQKNIQAICISSYSNDNNEVNARYVNLKFIKDTDFIFFSNYKSPKSRDFISHNQITGVLFWDSTNIQIRMKAFIKKTSKSFNDQYFATRDRRKNALAISSNQSKLISSYDDVIKNYEQSMSKDDLSKCPDFWGGFSFTPYYFEFWEGYSYRLNKRTVYQLENDKWNSFLLEP